MIPVKLEKESMRNSAQSALGIRTQPSIDVAEYSDVNYNLNKDVFMVDNGVRNSQGKLGKQGFLLSNQSTLAR